MYWRKMLELSYVIFLLFQHVGERSCFILRGTCSSKIFCQRNRARVSTRRVSYDLSL